MKNESKKKILLILSEEEKQYTTEEISKKLALSRSVTSLYLNQLYTERIIQKIPGKPVKWSLDQEVHTDTFNEFIGSEGSLKPIIEKCKAAVVYPPNGLTILLTGTSGVGKSYLARLIYQYAKDTQVISNTGKFVVLNCADYANNPELLSATLFGYAKGAFTGADEGKNGLLKEADGGYLFLDEVHRLSSENQEKIFLFMDTGEYRLMGETKKVEKAKVRFLFATTEDPQKVLLPTFKRRISVSIVLPEYTERPYEERLELIYRLYLREAQQIKKDIVVDKKVVDLLSQIKITGNIGKIGNMIKMSCAKAFKNNRTSETLIISQLMIESGDEELNQIKSINVEPLFVAYQNYGSRKKLGIDEKQILTQDFIDLFQKYLTKENGQISTLFSAIQLIYNQRIIQQKMVTTSILANRILFSNYIKQFKAIMEVKFGLKKVDLIGKISYQFHFLTMPDTALLKDLLDRIKKEVPRSFHVAQTFIESYSVEKNDFFTSIVTILLSEHVLEDIRYQGLMVAHGDATATSIQSVVNQLCGGYVFDAVDMPIETTIDEVLTKAKQLLKNRDTSHGVILLIDMGSLTQLYTGLKPVLAGELLVVNNLTTAIGLDLGLKIASNMPFKALARTAEEEYTISVQYFEGFSQNKQVIISCISGLGISEKIKAIMSHYLLEDFTILTLDYRRLKTSIQTNEKNYFKETMLVITTTTLPKSVDVPSVNIYEILDSIGEASFRKSVENLIQPNTFEKMMKELVYFFSIEGVGERLQFLNPAVVMSQVTRVLAKFEAYYQFSLDGKAKLNLHMHLALMIERMIISDIDESIISTEKELTKKEVEFFSVSKDIFEPIERTYNISISESEIEMLYELVLSVS
ncbi:sigma 54-interacting transcriptional regulator [Carnobacterium maltaromaticum]|uniref:sigma 54-interacting transcriptional regulator n=1 Tax=Carnobacterium maltaromaticum TaxID=2751 RepID=UPI00191BB492|nr:sigma 54-interacting transcriptional regulator [Carnobacterium maltaromaticum]CAD5901834.1 conserved hypothetical protein [Carnobacterium maltaromaticum]